MTDPISNGRQKRSISIHGHPTSISLEPEFWAVIDEAAKARKQSVSAFIIAQDDARTQADSVYGLAAYLRVWVLRSVIADKE